VYFNTIDVAQFPGKEELQWGGVNLLVGSQNGCPASAAAMISPCAAHKNCTTTLFVNLKLATTGSTWFGDTMGNVQHSKFHAEFIKHKQAFKTKPSFLSKYMATALNKCQTQPSVKVCGLSVNSKNAPHVDYSDVRVHHVNTGGGRSPPSPPAKTVVWIRSNVVAHAVGLQRAIWLHDKCRTNNVRVWEMKKCQEPPTIRIPIKQFKKQLTRAALYHAVNLGKAYQTWRCGMEIYEVYYESFLRNETTALRRLFDWLGHGYLIEKAPKAITVKTTSKHLKNVLENYDEIHTWLSANYPCYVPQLESNGDEVMPPCPMVEKPSIPGTKI
jgi:hypothetical protein